MRGAGWPSEKALALELLTQPAAPHIGIEDSVSTPQELLAAVDERDAGG